MFLDGEIGEKEIILLNVAWDSGEGICIDVGTVQVPLAEDLKFSCVPKSKAVEESGFAGSTGSHDGEKFTGTNNSSDCIEEINLNIMMLSRFLCKRNRFTIIQDSFVDGRRFLVDSTDTVCIIGLQVNLHILPRISHRLQSWSTNSVWLSFFLIANGETEI